MWVLPSGAARSVHSITNDTVSSGASGGCGDMVTLDLRNSRQLLQKYSCLAVLGCDNAVGSVCLGLVIKEQLGNGLGEDNGLGESDHFMAWKLLQFYVQ